MKGVLRYTVVFFGAIILGFASLLIGQEGGIIIESKVDKTKITIGDLITYTITITRDNTIEVEMPGLGVNLGAFEIRDYTVHEPKKVKGKIVERIDYLISTFDTGEFIIPPLVIRYNTVGDTLKKELTTEDIKIMVESLKPSETGDIKDIKFPLELPRDYRRLIYLGSAILAVLAMGILAYFFIKRQKEGRSLLPRRIKPPRPAHEIALEELQQLLESGLVEKGEVKQFYIEISDIIRRYIEGRFYLVALEMTTYELVQNMKSASIDESVIQGVNDFLELCDLVKFAKYLPTPEEHTTAISQAHEIVNRTKLVFEEVPEKPVEEKVPEPEVVSEPMKKEVA